MKLLVAVLACLLTAASASNDCLKANSCGQCIQVGAHCAWCTDPLSPLANRCQNKSLLLGNAKQCDPRHVYTPVTELKVSETTIPIGGKQHDMEVRLEPQVTQMKLKKGETLVARYKYKHQRPANDERAVNFEIQTSPIPQEVQAKFFIICEGKRQETKKCSNVPDGQLVDFEVEIKVKDCKHTTGTLSLSVGVVGYRLVSGLYITPMCGCECEILRFHEKSSHFCNRTGTLICGQCNCDAGKGGAHCECPLSMFGVSSAKALDDKCRAKPGEPLCGGRGQCKCGKCECDSPTEAGEFCGCDHTACPVGTEGRQCSGNGICECGKCKCEEGWSREDCSCTTSAAACIEDGETCSNHGQCECSKCVCHEGYTGAFCGAVEDEGAAEVVDSGDNDVKEKDDCEGDTCPLTEEDLNAQGGATTTEVSGGVLDGRMEVKTVEETKEEKKEEKAFVHDMEEMTDGVDAQEDSAEESSSSAEHAPLTRANKEEESADEPASAVGGLSLLCATGAALIARCLM